LLPTGQLEFRERPAWQQYPFGVIRLFVEFVMHAAVSLRGASGVLGIIQHLLPDVQRTPCANAGQMWLLRIGLYEVTRPKEKADDWVWLVDHTVQIGAMKCLLVVGCRLTAWQAERRPLEHTDLEVLALEPVIRSDGEVVQEQLEAVSRELGVPRAVVSDHGSDLKSGMDAFRASHPETASVYDIAHKTALIVKKELEGDERWSRFLQESGRAKQQVQQTPLAFLAPPSPKEKARYMNLEELVGWGQKALAYVKSPRPVGGAPVDKEKLKEKLGWLRGYRQALGDWQEVMSVVSTTLTYVRKEGYHSQASRALQRRLRGVAHAPISRRVADSIVQFVTDQSACAKAGERLIGSSECLESIIGKGKRLEKQQSKSGFTKMILAMGAAVVKPTREYLAAALEAVKVVDVVTWCRTKLGVSVQAQRRQAFACSSSGTKPG
jgi:hypothetical protein